MTKRLSQKRIALEKCHAAVTHKIFPGKVPFDYYLKLGKDGLVDWQNGWRLTNKGAAELKRLRRAAKLKAQQA